MKSTSTKWFILVAPLAAAAPLMLADCSGSSGNSPDAGADGTGGGSSGGTSSSGGSSGGATSSSSGGGASSGGTASSSGGGASSGGTASSSGGGGDGGVRDAAPPPVVCTDAGTPPGCVQCVTDSNCPTATPRCLNNACVMCETNSDCGNGATPSCWPSTHTCHASCAVDGAAACPAGAPICDTTTGACVGCRTGTDCPTVRPVCDTVNKVCEQCQTDTNCSGTTPKCDTAANPPACVACLTNPDCAGSTAGPVCRQVTHTCAPGCVSSSQCTDAGAMACDLTTNACVECVDNTTCAAPTPLCDLTVGARQHRCEQCLPATADAGIQGCDGGGLGLCQGAPGNPTGPLMCR